MPYYAQIDKATGYCTSVVQSSGVLESTDTGGAGGSVYAAIIFFG